MDNAAGLRLSIDPSEAYDQYQIAAINNYWEKCYEHLGTNGRTEVKQYAPPSSGAGV